MYLFWFEACEAEHANLVDDVLPVVGGALLLQPSRELLPHLDDPVGHAVDLLQPVHAGSKQHMSNAAPPSLVGYMGNIRTSRFKLYVELLY